MAENASANVASGASGHLHMRRLGGRRPRTFSSVSVMAALADRVKGHFLIDKASLKGELLAKIAWSRRMRTPRWGQFGSASCVKTSGAGTFQNAHRERAMRILLWAR